MIRGTSSIVSVERGSTDIQAVYRGSSLVWNREPTLKYILVSNSTTTSGATAFEKWDYQGNVISSRTYTQVGGSANWRPRRIFSEEDNSSFYYSTGDAASGTFIKWTTSLGIDRSASGSNSPSMIPVGDSVSNLLTCSTVGIGFRTKDLNTTGTSTAYTSGKKRPILISDLSSAPASIIFMSSTAVSNGTRRYTTNSGVSAYSTLVWQKPIAAAAGVYNKTDGEVLLCGTTSSLVIDVANGDTLGTASNVGTIQDSVSIFSNNDVLFYLSGDLRRRTWANVKSNSTTNVWSITLSSVVWFDIDDLDNLYVIRSVSTDGLQKYDKNGSLIWSRNLPANGFGGGLAHK
jgi:hypothetical protein